MGADSAGTPYVDREVLERLVDDLTVDDVRRAREEYPEGDPMRGFASVYHAAVRLEATLPDEPAAAFLARVRLRDLTPILEKATATLPNVPIGSSTLPGSAGSGG
jgi:hypothetical protein